MKKIILAIIIISFYLSATYSQQNTFDKCRNILNKREEVYFYFPAEKNELQMFSKMLSLDSFDGKHAYAYANPKQFEHFEKLNRNCFLVEKYYDFGTKALEMAENIEQMHSWNKYPYFEVYVEMMHNFASDYPEICKLDTIGFSVNNRPLLVAHITSDFNANQNLPEFFYTGQMHGDELVGGMLFLRLIDYLLANYGMDSEVTYLLENLNIYINPFANPDATWYGGNNTVEDSRRNNAENIDLNRNYPDAIDGLHPDGNSTAYENIAFINFANQRNFIMSANSHSGAECLNYPFDTYSILPADNDWWYFVCREYADHAQQNSPDGYLTDVSDGVTNGYAWYSISGSRQDYMNFFHNCREVTLELSTDKKLDSNLLPNHWDYNRDALLDYMKQATYGLFGQITDSLTGEVLQAKIYINNHDYFNSHVFSNQNNGYYYRLLYQGTYDVKYIADNYKSKTFTVDINNHEKQRLDVQLVKLESLPPFADFEIIDNPFNCNARVSFINTSESSDDTQYFWDFGDGSNIISDINPTHNYSKNGAYSVKLLAENSNGNDSVIKENLINIQLETIENISNAVICENQGSHNFDIDIDDARVLWFENILDVDYIYEGTDFQTTNLNQTTKYYLQKYYDGNRFSIGENDNSEGGEYIDDFDNHYLYFDCYQPVILESVKVYASTSEERTIFIRNSQDEILLEKTVYIEEGEQIIDLNIHLEQAENLKIGCYGPSNLFRGFSGIFSTFDFPYQNEYISINGSNTTLWNDDTRYYSYFYDWKIKEYDCYSEKTEITVFVNEDIQASFDYDITNNNVKFINNSIAADSFEWDFGDGNSSQEINPEHSYSNAGNYQVKLTALSECGEDIFIDTITVLTGNIKQNIVDFSIFPNPASSHIKINATNFPYQVSIYSTDGVKLFEESIYEKNKEFTFVKQLNSGFYIVEIIYNGTNYRTKLIISK